MEEWSKNPTLLQATTYTVVAHDIYGVRHSGWGRFHLQSIMVVVVYRAQIMKMMYLSRYLRA